MVVFNSLPVEPLRITSRFGKRNTGISGASTDHKGIDLGRDFKKNQTEILSVASGVVASNYWNDYRGWVVTIKHQGFTTLYQHLAKQSQLKVGSKVNGGDVIGIMGASSNPEKLKIATHLHFELIVNGKQIDPEPYFYKLEEEDMITRTKIEINGSVKEVDTIQKDGFNFVKLRDLDDAIIVDYDATRKLPIVKSKEVL